MNILKFLKNQALTGPLSSITLRHHKICLYCGVLGCGRLLDLGVIGNYDTPPKDTTQITGYRQLAPGTRCRSPA